MKDELQIARDRAEVLERQLDDLHDRYSRLRDAFGQSLDAPLSLGLTLHEARILGALLAKKQLTQTALMEFVYAEKVADDDLPEIKIIDVFVCKLRKKLKAFDIDIITAWGQGYGLPRVRRTS
jgi:two-component system, cell cycle response regulator CtrA